MSNIQGLGQSSPIARTQATKAAGAATPASPTARADRADKVELNSTAAAMLAKLKGSSDVRLDKVQSLKSQIDAGTYDVDGKLSDGTLDKMLDDMA